jgi:hypothetical protein
MLFVFSGCEETAKALSTTISGTVTNEDGAPVAGALILVVEYDSEHITGILSGQPLESLSISFANGSYTVIEVDPGSYMVFAIKDNGNWQVDLMDDEIYFYGTSVIGFPSPTMVTIVNEGDDISGININQKLIP